MEAAGPLATRLQQAKGWDNAMRELMLAGKHLQVFPDAAKTIDNQVPGCQSKVWLVHLEGTTLAWSDAKIMRGVLAILLEAAGSHHELATEDDFIAYMEALGLSRYLSESRANGMRHVVGQLCALR